MALYKEIRQEDGVRTNYHRILFINNTINEYTAIAVLSYTDNEARKDEQEDTVTIPYRKSVTYQLPYDESMTIEKAYEYLKTLDIFQGAEDV